jgi:hypothetical protein
MWGIDKVKTNMFVIYVPTQLAFWLVTFKDTYEVDLLVNVVTDITRFSTQ